MRSRAIFPVSFFSVTAMLLIDAGILPPVRICVSADGRRAKRYHTIAGANSLAIPCLHVIRSASRTRVENLVNGLR
jgi:hypothetical protein